MKVLITGSEGQVGTALREAAPPRCEIFGTTRRDLDITDSTEVENIIGNIQPNWIVNAAAYTAVDRAESEPLRAHAVNALGPGTLARAAVKYGGRLLQLSTDYVFSGEASMPYRPDSPTGPLGVYGSTKLAGEIAVERETSGDALIVRTSWVYASRGSNFVLRMMDRMSSCEEVPVVQDQLGSPTWARSVAACIWGLIVGEPRHGIYHWTDDGITSWYDFAIAIEEEARARGLLQRAVRVRPIYSAEYPTAARRPRYSVLDTRATAEALSRRPQPWRANLRKMLDELVPAP